MYPDDVICFGQVHRILGEAFIYFDISFKVPIIKLRQIHAAMKDRPQNTIGISEVKIFIFRFGVITQREVNAVLFGFGKTIAWKIVNLSAPPHP